MTTPVTRYDFHDDGFDNCDMRVDLTGEYVDYTDYARVEAERDRLRAELEMLRKTIGEAMACLLRLSNADDMSDVESAGYAWKNAARKLYALCAPAPSAKGDAT